MEAEWQNRVINGPTRPMLPFSASVGKRAWTPEARMPRSRPNSEVGTAPIYVL